MYNHYILVVDSSHPASPGASPGDSAAGPAPRRGRAGWPRPGGLGGDFHGTCMDL